jgi:hypothetical protein
VNVPRRLGSVRDAYTFGALLLLPLTSVVVPMRPPVAGVIASTRVMGPEGIGLVHFGLAKSETVADLTGRLGKAAPLGTNTACGPRYSEVEWGDLVAEFRLGLFSGYRYLNGGWPLATPGFPRRPPLSSGPSPLLATAKGISLGSTLTQVQGAYGEVRFVGVDKWQAANGLVFVVDAPREPEPPSSKVVEIKFGTCGDF